MTATLKPLTLEFVTEGPGPLYGAWNLGPNKWLGYYQVRRRIGKGWKTHTARRYSPTLDAALGAAGAEYIMEEQI